MEQIPLAVKLHDAAVFSTFRDGPNQLAVEYLRSVATGEAQGGAWLWGAGATGKTHLLQAVCAAAGDAGRRAAYLPLDQLGAHGAAVLEGWETQNLVAVDGLDAVIGHRDVEAGLFSLYNALADQGGVMIAASRGAPSGLPFALQDLRSRLAAGAVFHVRPLEEADAAAVLRLRARHRGLELPDDVAAYLLRRVPRDMASLCEWLERLDVASLAAQRRLTVPFVREVLLGGPGQED
jgi:DnaA family protein